MVLTPSKTAADVAWLVLMKIHHSVGCTLRRGGDRCCCFCVDAALITRVIRRYHLLVSIVILHFCNDSEADAAGISASAAGGCALMLIDGR
jgi:hypothetical protein